MAGKLLTAADVADRLGISPVTVWRRAKAASIGQRVGAVTFFREADIARLARAPKPGRPRKTKQPD